VFSFSLMPCLEESPVFSNGARVAILTEFNQKKMDLLEGRGLRSKLAFFVSHWGNGGGVRKCLRRKAESSITMFF